MSRHAPNDGVTCPPGEGEDAIVEHYGRSHSTYDDKWLEIVTITWRHCRQEVGVKDEKGRQYRNQVAEAEMFPAKRQACEDHEGEENVILRKEQFVDVEHWLIARGKKE